MTDQTRLDFSVVMFCIGFVGWVILLTTLIHKPRIVTDVIIHPDKEWTPR